MTTRSRADEFLSAAQNILQQPVQRKEAPGGYALSFGSSTAPSRTRPERGRSESGDDFTARPTGRMGGVENYVEDGAGEDVKNRRRGNKVGEDSVPSRIRPERESNEAREDSLARPRVTGGDFGIGGSAGGRDSALVPLRTRPEPGRDVSGEDFPARPTERTKGDSDLRMVARWNREIGVREDQGRTKGGGLDSSGNIEDESRDDAGNYSEKKRYENGGEVALLTSRTRPEGRRNAFEDDFPVRPPPLGRTRGDLDSIVGAGGNSDIGARKNEVGRREPIRRSEFDTGVREGEVESREMMIKRDFEAKPRENYDSHRAMDDTGVKRMDTTGGDLIESRLGTTNGNALESRLGTTGSDNLEKESRTAGGRRRVFESRLEGTKIIEANEDTGKRNHAEFGSTLQRTTRDDVELIGSKVRNLNFLTSSKAVGSELNGGARRSDLNANMPSPKQGDDLRRSDYYVSSPSSRVMSSPSKAAAIPLPPSSSSSRGEMVIESHEKVRSFPVSSPSPSSKTRVTGPIAMAQSRPVLFNKYPAFVGTNSPPPPLDSETSSTSTTMDATAARRKADAFLSAAEFALVGGSNKIGKVFDPRAISSLDSKIILRSFRGTCLRKSALGGNRAETGGSMYDFEECELIMCRTSSRPVQGDVLMFGDSVSIRTRDGAFWLSGTEFTREMRGTWTIRSNSMESSSGLSLSTPKKYVCASDSIALEFDANQRFLGVPAVPRDADGSAFATLEVTKSESSQRWNILLSQGAATLYFPAAPTFPEEDVEDHPTSSASTLGTSMLMSFLGVLKLITPEVENYAMMKRVGMLVSDVDFIREYAKSHSTSEWGRVAQALSCHLQESVLDPFDEYMAGLFIVGVSPTLVFSAAESRCRELQDWTRTLRPVYFLRGGALLNALYDARFGQFETPTRVDDALRACLIPYCESLKRWMTIGEILDPFDEFLVKEDASLTHDELASVYNARYWNDKYSLREMSNVPWFLRRVAKQVLMTGRDLEACFKVGRGNVRLVQSLLSEDEFDDGDELLVDEQEELVSMSSRVLLRAHSQAARRLLDVLQNSQLYDRLDSLKRFFLLERGDYFVRFMDVAGDDLMKPARELNCNRLETLLHVAMKEREFPDAFLDEVTCLLFPNAVDTHVERIHHVEFQSSSNFSVQTTAADQDTLLGVDAFCLDFTAPWPLSIVLSRRVMTKYQLLFRHLFRCKHGFRTVCRAWLDLRKRGKGHGSDDVMGHALVQRMVHFLQNLEYYMAFEVIEPRWNAFRERAKKVTTVDDLLNAHEEFLDTCLRECLLTNPTLIRGLSKLLRSCLSLSRAVDVGTLAFNAPQKIEDFDAEMKWFLACLTTEAEKGEFTEHLPNLRVRLDFSGLYARDGVGGGQIYESR